MLLHAQPCGFFEGIDSIITKNHKFFGVPGSPHYKRLLTRKRKEFLDKWFNYFPGLHNNLSKSIFSDCLSIEIECKSDFCCLLLDLDKSDNCYKTKLRQKLHLTFEKLTKDSNGEIYSILLFLLQLQNVRNAKIDYLNSFDFLSIESDLSSYKSVPDFNDSYPQGIFSRKNLPDFSPTISTDYRYISYNNNNIDDCTIASPPSLITDLSDFCSIKRSTILSTSGYYTGTVTGSGSDCVTAVDQCVSTVDSTNSTRNVSVVSYPFSHFSDQPIGRTVPSWDEEFMEEWRAFETGEELPRRFVWEDRGRNVGPEKPRLIEWNCPFFPTGNSAICLVLNELRSNKDCCNEMSNAILNSYAVPIDAWINDLILVRLGVASTTFHWDPVDNRFRLVATPPIYLAKQFEPHVKAGTIFSRLCLLIEGISGFRVSVIRNGLLDRLRDIIAIHRDILTGVRKTFTSVTEFSHSLLSLTTQIEYLGDLFEVNPKTVKSWPEHVLNNSPIKIGGLVLLKHVYQVCVQMVIPEHLFVTFYLLEGCLGVILDQLQHWLFKGEIFYQLNLQYTNDFLFFPNDNYLNTKDGDWWRNQFKISEGLFDTNNSWIFSEFAKEILRCGKSIRLLGIIKDSHELIHDSKVIACRPPLKLYNVSDDTNRNSIEEYVKTVKTVAANALRSQKELLEEKKRIAKQKALEAHKVREDYLKYIKQKRLQQEIEIFNEKKKKLSLLKIEAERVRQQKDKEKKAEKQLDKHRVEKNLQENRDIIDELKSDITKDYAQKIADSEKKEKFFLNKAEESKSKYMKISNQPNLDIKKYERISEVIPDKNIEEEEHQINNEESSDIPNLYIDHLSDISKDNYVDLNLKNNIIEGNIQDKESKELNTKFDSTVPNLLDPSSSPSVVSDSKDLIHIKKFQNINTHGHTSDSSAEKLLYPDHNIIPQDYKAPIVVDHMTQFHKINIHGHTADSSVQDSLYPDASQPNATLTDHNKRIISYGYSSQSTIQDLMYPQKHIGPSPLQTNNSNSTLISDHFPSDLDIPTASTNITDNSNDSRIPICCPETAFDWISKIQQEISMRSLVLQSKTRCSVHPSSSFHINSFYTPTYPNSGLMTRTNESVETSPPLDIESHPIDIIINRSLVPILTAQLRLADSALMYSILHEQRFCDHLTAIRNYLFLEDGRFSSRLLPTVFQLVSSWPWKTDRVNKSNKSTLSDLLKSAVNCDHNDDSSMCFCKFVHVPDLSSHSQSNQIIFDNRLDNFCISYSILWPLNIIIEPRQISQYQSIFRSIIQIKFAGWSIFESRKIVDSWYSKSKSKYISDQFMGDQFRPIYSCLAEMEHWIRSIDSSIGSQVSGAGALSWHRLTRQLNDETISNIDLLIESHSVYLDGIIERCVLAGDETGSITFSDSVRNVRRDIRKILIGLLNLCCRLHRYLSSHHWQLGSTTPTDDNNTKIVRSVSELHQKFKKIGICLVRVIRAASQQDGYVEHLFLSIDFNGFYDRLMNS